MTDCALLKPGELRSSRHACPWSVELAVCVVIPLYFAAFNYLPFMVLLSYPLLGSWRVTVATLAINLLLAYFVGNFGAIVRRLSGGSRLPKGLSLGQFHLEAQYHRERLTNIYFNKKYILADSLLSSTALADPVILAVAPHGVVPWGNTGAQSKLFGGRPTKWAAAPVLFRIPLLRPLLQQYGAFPASKEGILTVLSEGYNAGIVLDGIAGMFTNSKAGHEQLALRDRQAICAIALKAKANIVPGYCFGTNEVASVVQDPFGLLRWLSVTLDVSLTPFLGRWSCPMGPPRPEPLVFAYGDVIKCMDRFHGFPNMNSTDERESAFRAAVDLVHKQLLSAFMDIFELHKGAYGWDGRMEFV